MRYERCMLKGNVERAFHSWWVSYSNHSQSIEGKVRDREASVVESLRSYGPNCNFIFIPFLCHLSALPTFCGMSVLHTEIASVPTLDVPMYGMLFSLRNVNRTDFKANWVRVIVGGNRTRTVSSCVSVSALLGSSRGLEKQRLELELLK